MSWEDYIPEDIKELYEVHDFKHAALIPRLKAGRNGGCPVLVFGITTKLFLENEK